MPTLLSCCLQEEAESRGILAAELVLPPLLEPPRREAEASLSIYHPYFNSYFSMMGWLLNVIY